MTIESSNDTTIMTHEPQSFEEYQSLVNTIIDEESVMMVFQPIVDLLDGGIIGYEALLRGPEQSVFHAPIPLLQAAEVLGRLFELECIARKRAIESFILQSLPGKLFLNMSPMSLQDPNFESGYTLSLLNKLNFAPDRIVIEITEHHPIRDYHLLVQAIEHYRGMGFTIALDDLGEGHSSLRLWSELKPDYIKLDKHFITNLEAEGKHKLQFVKTITELAHSVETKVIAEGIETLECLELLQSINVHLGQGFYFAKPAELPSTASNWQMPESNLNNVSTTLSRHARDIVKDAPCIHESAIVSDAVDFFLKHPEYEAVAVINGQEVLGLLERKDITELFSSRFGRELNGRKHIGQFVDRRSLIVSASTPLEVISKMITQRNHSSAQGVFVVTDLGRYVGLGYFNDLLRAITETKISLAKSANPLTGLPGNQAIENAVQKRLTNRKSFMLLYVDLDHFKSYNDFFSYELGDKALITLANILEEHTHHSEFIGHIGGDDFILLWKEKEWQKRLERIFKDFTAHYPDWYTPENIKEKGFYGKDRNDQPQFFSLMCLSIGVIAIEAGQFEFYHQIASLSGEAKKKAKAIAGNSWYLLNPKN